MNFDRGLISRHAFSLYSLIVILAMSFVFYAIWDLRESKEQVVHEIASTFSGVIDSAHKLYTRQIVPIARRNNLPLAVKYRETKNSFPWPETFSRELASTMSKIHPNTSMATYSNNPHSSQKNRVLDEFQKIALKNLENGSPLYYEIFDNPDGKYVRYAKPVKMIQLCADCHNNPAIGFAKNDWKRGDFAGVREVKFPFPHALIKVEKTIESIAIVLTGAVILGLFVVAPMLRRQNVENNTLSKRTKVLQVEANTDPLTGLYNRRYLEDMLGPYIKEFTRENISIGIIALDLDHFKAVNDTYGHEVGDDVLIRMANCLNNVSREHDIVARTGGEEFIVVVPVTGDVQAAHLADRYRKAVENIKIKGDGYTICPTASFGVSTSCESQDCAQLVKLADSRLYEAKRTGRNKVVSGSRVNFTAVSNSVEKSNRETMPA